jgi:hypothetical protein
MRSSLAGALVALAAAAAGAQSLTQQAGTDLRGADYSQFPAHSANECRAICERDSRCAAYTYRLNNSLCFLKSAVPPESADRNAISGFRSGSLGWTGGGWAWNGRLTEQWGLDRRGGDYASFASRDLHECQRQCAEQRQCRAYTFRRDSRECFLKNVVTPERRADTVVTGVKLGGGPGPGIGPGPGFGNLTEERGFDRRGGDYSGFQSPGPDACKRSCAVDRRCRAYTYRFDSRECFLKDRVYPSTPERRAVTGAKM